DNSTTEVCHLNTATPTAATSDYQGKYVWMASGASTGGTRFQGLLNNSLGDTVGGAVASNEGAGLTISAAHGDNFGISVGQCLYPSFRDIVSTSGWCGIGSFATSAGVYDVTANDCLLAGTDAGYFGINQIVSIRNMRRVDCGHTAVPLSGCAAHLAKVQVGSTQQPVTDAYIYIHSASAYSSVYRIADVSVDVEGIGPNAPKAAVYCERHSTGNTVLDIDGIAWGSLATTKPVVWLARPN